MLARVINNEGVFLLALGRWEEAARAYEEAAHMHLEIGHLGDAAISLLNRAEIPAGPTATTEQAQARLQQAGELLDALPGSPTPVRQYYAALLERADRQSARPAKQSRAEGLVAQMATVADDPLSRRKRYQTGTSRSARRRATCS